ncbi:MAG: exostosin domain-containing protein [Solirubrobacteraceae bacterium]
MLVHLARLHDPYLDQPVGAFTTHASTDRVGAHRLTESADEADVILFTQCHLLEEWSLRRLRQHPLTHAFPEKTLVYNELDRPWCALPGVYVNMPKPHFVARHQRAWGYFTPPPSPPPTVARLERDLLFSFIASNTARSREPLFALRHPDAIVEEVRGFRFWDERSPGFERQRERFRDVLARSRFVLCPRGNGTSSVRLYESLAAGAVPVIVADDWLPPAGPEWERFSISWPEGRIGGLTRMLEARDADWQQMSAEARSAYEEHFSPATYFHHVANLCGDLIDQGSPSSFPASGVVDRHAASLAARSARDRAKFMVIAASRRMGRRPG